MALKVGNINPYLVDGEIRQPDSDYVLIPRHSSENRRYIPMVFFDKQHIASDSCIKLPHATLYHFGILTSVHEKPVPGRRPV
jgi:hypothetical protein